ncbi:MAG: hypothetical protein HY360_27010 [Verrucomicrobia bacterium]|nr:hypothetical protein [Verrucomicrobiota bacterium]
MRCSAVTATDASPVTLRLASSFPWGRHRFSIGKFVRSGHLQTSHGWMHHAVVVNDLAA